MALTHYQRAVLLLIRKHSTLVTAQNIGRKLFKAKRSEVQELCASCCALDPLFYLERTSGGWLMRSPDRDQPISEAFLLSCEPSWAQEIREAMAGHEPPYKKNEDELKVALNEVLALLGGCVRSHGCAPCGECAVCRARALVTR
jgi:hypothetical protein